MPLVDDHSRSIAPDYNSSRQFVTWFIYSRQRNIFFTSLEMTMRLSLLLFIAFFTATAHSGNLPCSGKKGEIDRCFEEQFFAAMAPSAHRNAFAPNQKPAHHPVYPKLRRQVRAAHVVAAMVNTVPVRAAALFVIPKVEGSLILGSESRQPTARTQSTRRPRTSGRCSPAWPHQTEKHGSLPRSVRFESECGTSVLH